MYKPETRKCRNYNTKRLFRAVKDGNAPMVSLLLKKGVRIHARDDYDRTFLHVNAVSGHRRVTRLLLRAGCRINSINGVGDTALHEAISFENLAVAHGLICAGANVRHKNCNGDTVLHFAAVHRKSLELVKLLLHAGARLNSTNVYGMSALHCAVESKNVRVVRLLIDRGIRVNSARCGGSALHMAAGIGSATIVRMLLAAGACIDRKDMDNCSALQCAIDTGNVKLVRTLILAGVDLDNRNKIGATALHNAIMCGNEAMIDLLMQHGSSVRVKTAKGDTPLHWASMLNVGHSHENILQSLLSKDSDVNDRNADGQTPFHFLVQDGDRKMVKLFLKHESSIMKTDFEGATALHYASKQSRAEHIKQLVSSGADVNAKDNSGCTPLYYTITEPYSFGERPNIAEERHQTVSLLLECGTDVNQTIHRQHQEKTILEISIDRRDTNVTNIILEHMAKMELRNSGVLSEHNLRLIEMYPEVKGYYETCQKELRITREWKIFGTVSFFSILTESIEVIARYARNQELIEVFEASDYETSFPIYRRPLKAKFYEGVERQKLMDSAATILSNTLHFADPYHVAFEKILSCLSSEDLIVLVDSVFKDD